VIRRRTSSLVGHNRHMPEPPSCIRRSASIAVLPGGSVSGSRAIHPAAPSDRVLGLGEHSHRIPAGEDPEKPFLFITPNITPMRRACICLQAS
jgi:hypothetical protein